jgi:hypothetical protein
LNSCSGITNAGGRCRAIAISGSDYCHAHHPNRAAARRRAASKGGKRGGRGRPQVELTNIKDQLQELADNVLAGDVDKGVATVASQILNVYLRAVSVELKVREQQELEERLAELEALMEHQKQGGRGYGA